jgi:hypothetical protein
VRTTRDLPRLLVEKPTALADNRNAKDLQDFFAVAAAAATAAVIIIVAAATSAIASVAAAAATVAVAVAAECEDISDPHTDPSL